MLPIVLCVVCGAAPGAATDEEAETVEVPEPVSFTPYGRKDAIDEAVREILSVPLEERAYGAQVKCVMSHSYQSIELIRDRGVIFVGRGDKAWLNTWHNDNRCAGPYYRRYLIEVRQQSRRVCALDEIFFVDNRLGERQVAKKCRLGPFEPITRKQAEYIKAAASEPRTIRLPANPKSTD